MQLHLPLELPSFAKSRKDLGREFLAVRGRCLPLNLVHNRRARRYVLRLQRGGIVRVTIPRGGSKAEGKRFAGKNIAWLERQLLRQAMQEPPPEAWRPGSEFLFRGVPVKLESRPDGEANRIAFGDEVLRVANAAGDFRREVQEHLWTLARRELPDRVFALATRHQVPVRRVFVRNQRSRWGSCSRRGTVSLNWRLIQTPDFVRDYLILHELMHFKQMNHSRRFWREVSRVCPDFADAERWLKQHSALLR